MIKVMAAIIVMLSLNAQASEVKPGLWEIKMKVIKDGKTIDPMAEVMKELEKLPEDQKKLIMEQIKKESASSNNFSQVCYTKEMVKNPSKIESIEDENCQYNEKVKTPKKVVATFKCNDGKTGTSTWELKDANNMLVVIDATEKDGKKSRLEYSSKFLKSQCN